MMSPQLACQALREARVIECEYDGFRRVVEVHAVGYAGAGKPRMRVFQVGGNSKSGKINQFKLFDLDDVRGASIGTTRSQAPRHGYRRDDRAFSRFECRL